MQMILALAAILSGIVLFNGIRVATIRIKAKFDQ